MIPVDAVLAERARDDRPVQVGLVGAGFMGRAIALQIAAATTGMRLAAISNRTLDAARVAYRQAGVADCARAETGAELDARIAEGRCVVTDQPGALCESRRIDVIIEATGSIEFAAGVAMDAFAHGKHLVLMNAELDATLGPILKVYADRAGVVMTNVNGDEPGVVLDLYRFVTGAGFQVPLAGNVKGLLDPYRTPETQKAFAEEYKQRPHMVTSFADGTKVSAELTVVANATGLRAGRRGLYGHRCEHVRDLVGLFDMDDLRRTGGLVEYALGAAPPGGVFVIGYNENPIQREYLRYYKMGDGPYYVFYSPYHLCHLELPETIGRAVLFAQATAAPLGRPVCDVVATAKRDLAAGETLDGIGGFMTYGQMENTDTCLAENLLPMGLAGGCRLRRDVPKDRVLTYDDVDLPAGRLCDRLRAEEIEYFGLAEAAARVPDRPAGQQKG